MSMCCAGLYIIKMIAVKKYVKKRDIGNEHWTGFTNKHTRTMKYHENYS